MKIYRVVATLLVLIFLSNTTIFAVENIETVQAENNIEIDFYDQVETKTDEISEKYLKQVTLPNGKIKNPKLPKTFSIDDSTIYILKPIPVDTDENIENDTQTNRNLILIPAQKSSSENLPNTEQSTVSTQLQTTPITNEANTSTQPETISNAIETPTQPVTITTLPTTTTQSVTSTAPVTTTQTDSITTPVTAIESIQPTTSTKSETPETPETPVTDKSSEPEKTEPTVTLSRSVYEEPEIEVYSDSSDESDLKQTPMTINRQISVKNNQYLDIYCDGRSWIFLGEINNKDNVTYNSKKTENGNTKFTFRTSNPGLSILHFYKQDIVANSWIDDYCEITVLDEKAANPKDRTTVPVKAETTVNEEIQEINLVQPVDVINDQNNPEVILTSDIGQIEQSTSDEELLKQAEKLFAEAKYTEVITTLSNLKNTDTNQDRKLFLEAQTYEVKSDIQNIQKAYNLYKELISDYPQSKFYTQAKERLKYIDNYYFSIR